LAELGSLQDRSDSIGEVEEGSSTSIDEPSTLSVSLLMIASSSEKSNDHALSPNRSERDAIAFAAGDHNGRKFTCNWAMTEVSKYIQYCSQQHTNQPSETGITAHFISVFDNLRRPGYADDTGTDTLYI